MFEWAHHLCLRTLSESLGVHGKFTLPSFCRSFKGKPTEEGLRDADHYHSCVSTVGEDGVSTTTEIPLLAELEGGLD